MFIIIFNIIIRPQTACFTLIYVKLLVKLSKHTKLPYTYIINEKRNRPVWQYGIYYKLIDPEYIHYIAKNWVTSF